MQTMARNPVATTLLAAGLLLTGATLLTSCGGSSSEKDDALSYDQKGILRFEKIDVFDPGAGVTAFSMLIPKGWQHEGGVVWRPYLSNQATVAMRVWNPNGTEVFELMPCDPFTWNQAILMYQQPGSIYLGNELRQPVADPATFIMQLAIPRYRQEIQNPQVVQTTPLPTIASSTAQARAEPGVRKTGNAARVRVAYAMNGQPMEEDFVCVLLFATPYQMPALSFWGPDSLYSFRAVAGSLDAAQTLWQTMASSIRITPQWFNIAAQVQQMWMNNQMQAIRDAGKISQIIAQTNDEISDMIRQSYENRQASQDRISREFSEMIRGVETYTDPFQSTPVQLPATYDHAWVSANGDYLIAESASFDPNRHDRVEWRRMQREP